MAATSQKRLKQILTERLGLSEPEFYLERLSGGKLSGNIVSDTFNGLALVERQRRIWEALDGAFPGRSALLVGTLLAYTKDEWHVNLADA